MTSNAGDGVECPVCWLWVLESLKLRKAAAESLPRPRSATPSPRGTSRQGSQNVDTFYQPAYPGTQIRSQTSWLSMGRLRVRGQQRGHSAGVHVGAPLARTTRFLLKLPLVFLLFFIIFLILPISAGILFVYFFTSLFFTIPCSAVAIGAISCAEVLIRNILS
eukprot:jgi/Mesen1/1140/ME001236S00024